MTTTSTKLQAGGIATLSEDSLVDEVYDTLNRIQDRGNERDSVSGRMVVDFLTDQFAPHVAKVQDVRGKAVGRSRRVILLVFLIWVAVFVEYEWLKVVDAAEGGR
ncbi:hypothetical protein BDW59DRAFT_150611 [Aspergillus cavernicola]|uniref:Uncharacterized protein n=1 Tax=Aspergillus cavernicola TaxID=176166 RepID=A0ABR4HZA7_9EURO